MGMKDQTGEEVKALIDALVVPLGIEDDEDPVDYLIDHIAEAAALLTAALRVVIEASKHDERTLL